MIDVNRGVTKRRHPKGFAVCMYKDEPGAYFDKSGRELSSEIAGEAGFPVAQYAKERARRARLAEVLDEVNAEFGQLAQGAVVSEQNGFKVVYGGNGTFFIADPDGKPMDTPAMSKAEAVKLVRKLAKGEADKVNSGK